MPRFRLAVACATALSLLCPLPAPAEVMIRLDVSPQWRQADDVSALAEVLEAWLDAHAPWPRRATPPRITLVSAAEAAARQGLGASFQRGRLRGLYDPQRGEILLVTPWDRLKAEDVSVLLHELVHHRQAPHHFYCPAAQEEPAYRLQDQWLAERGLRADVNWIAVILDAGCTPRDIHPD